MALTIDGVTLEDGAPLLVGGVQAQNVMCNGVEVWKNKTFEITQFTMTVGFYLYFANEFYGFNSYAFIYPQYGSTSPDPLISADGSRVVEGGTQSASEGTVFMISAYIEDDDFFSVGTYKIQIEGYISEEIVLTEEAFEIRGRDMQEAYDLIRASLDQTLNCAIHYMAP